MAAFAAKTRDLAAFAASGRSGIKTKPSSFIVLEPRSALEPLEAAQYAA